MAKKIRARDCHLKPHHIAVCLAAALGACSMAPPRPAPPVVLQQPPPVRHAAPDWFHRQLAMARHARATHLPPGDKLGAQRAYYNVMVPACQKVAKVGPEKYRARCTALVQHAAADAAAANDDFACATDYDDSMDSEAEKTACDD